MSEEFAFRAGVVFGAIVSGICCFMIGDATASMLYKTEAIKRGYAEHDSKTGEWRWVEPKEKAE